jgi:predicted DNA-binding protein (UPF0251 family)
MADKKRPGKKPAKPARKAPAKKAAKPKPKPKPKARNPGARSATSVQDVLADLRQAQAIELRTQGLNFREIAARLEVSVATAHSYVTAGLAELTHYQHAKATELRAIEVARLDRLMGALWPWATGETGELLRKAREDAEARELTPKDLAKLLAELPPAGVPDGVAAKRVLECIIARARLQGLEAPIKHAHTNPDGTEERPPGSYVFPVAPGVTLEQWQQLASAAQKAGA